MRQLTVVAVTLGLILTGTELRAAEDETLDECRAGSIAACLSVCTAAVAVCTKQGPEYSKGKCDSKAQKLPGCTASYDELRPGDLCRISADEIYPTQFSVGSRAVACKAEDKIDKKKRKALKEYLLARFLPTVLGPRGRFYITDHHHLSTGVFRADIPHKNKVLYACITADQSMVERESALWQYLGEHQEVWLFDNEGHPITGSDLPLGLEYMADDPYRTVSRWVRDSCGYVKEGNDCLSAYTDEQIARYGAPAKADFMEFLWANFFRDNGVPSVSSQHTKEELEAVLSQALELAKSAKAQDLPGFNDGSILPPHPVVLDARGCDSIPSEE